MVTLVLVGAAVVLSLGAAIGKAPLWVPVFLLALLELLRWASFQ